MTQPAAPPPLFPLKLFGEKYFIKSDAVLGAFALENLAARGGTVFLDTIKRFHLTFVVYDPENDFQPTHLVANGEWKGPAVPRAVKKKTSKKTRRK